VQPNSDEEILRAAYRAFNARDIEAALALMHHAVDWPNAWEGGRVVGRSAVAAYWTRQFEQVSSRVEPLSFKHMKDGAIVAEVHQVVHDARSGELISDSLVLHRWRLEGGLVTRMDVSRG
jgi:hypothetical protein